MVRATGRQTESHKEESASAPLTLTDMLHIVPSMFGTMSSDARRTLLTVNRAFRKHMHETADLVLADWTDVPLIVKGDWACLQSLTLTDDSGSRRSVLRSGASPFPGLQQVHWPCLKHLSLSKVRLSNITMSQLLEADLPHLEDLDLSNSKLTHSTLLQLTTLNKWPLLKRLNLSQNKLDRAGVALLAQADWPILQQLVLSKCRLDAACTIFLAGASWPELKWLHLDSNCFWYQRHVACWFPSWPLLEYADLSGGPEWGDERPGAHSVLCAVANAQWLHLKHLDLSGRHHELESADVLCLTRGHWPGLSTLSLSGSLLHCELLESLAHLVHASWPVLQDLDLSRQCGTDMHTEFGDGDTYWVHGHAAMLSQGTWPMLKRLNLSHNMMFPGCMPILAQGQWPLLEALEMTDCSMDREDLSDLFMANWPLIRDLDLSRNSKELRFAKLANNHAILNTWPLLQRLNDVELSFKPAYVDYCSIVQKQTRRRGLGSTVMFPSRQL